TSQSRGGAVWQLVGLITRRSKVQILPPQPNNQEGAVWPAKPFCDFSGVCLSVTGINETETAYGKHQQAPQWRRQHLLGRDGPHRGLSPAGPHFSHEARSGTLGGTNRIGPTG